MNVPMVRVGSLPAVGVAVAALSLAPLGAQQPAPRPMPPMERPQTVANPLVASVRATYDRMKGYVIAAADEMPAAEYGFRPATAPASDHATVRTFAAILGHVASENYGVCAEAQAATAPAGTADLETTQTTKAGLTVALAASFAYCDGVWNGTTDQTASQSMPGSSRSAPASTRLGLLVANTAHEAEHYGNLVTYLRAKGLVPPSSQPRK